MNTAFPIYRKYNNNLSYFKVLSNTQFEEIKYEFGKWKLYKFNATILPDRNFIMDMINETDKHWDKITDAEYEQVLVLTD